MTTWRNTRQTYGWINIALHWGMAVAIIGLFSLGLYMVDLDYYNPWYHRAPFIHKSVAILLAMVYLFRVVWRLINPKPQSLSSKRWQQRAAKIVHGLFYVLLALMFLSGYFISTAEGHGVSVFDWFEVPAFVLGIDEQADIAGEFHEVFAWLLISLAVGHALIGLKHHFIDRDNTLKRMLKPIN